MRTSPSCPYACWDDILSCSADRGWKLWTSIPRASSSCSHWGGTSLGTKSGLIDNSIPQIQISFLVFDDTYLSIIYHHSPWAEKSNRGGNGWPLGIVPAGSRRGSKNGWHSASIADTLCCGWYWSIFVIKSTASSGAPAKIYIIQSTDQHTTSKNRNFLFSILFSSLTLDKEWGLIWGNLCST